MVVLYSNRIFKIARLILLSRSVKYSLLLRGFVIDNSDKLCLNIKNMAPTVASIELNYLRNF